MKQTTIQFKFDFERYNALARYAKKKELLIESELEDTIDKLYKKLVPADVREFIEENAEFEKEKNQLKKKNSALKVEKYTAKDFSEMEE